MTNVQMLTDIVCQNPSTLTTLGGKETAERVVEELIWHRKMPTEVLTRQILNSRFPATLLVIQIKELSRKPKHLVEIAKVLEDSTDEIWHAFSYDELKRIAAAFDKAKVFGLLTESRLRTFADPDHPLFSLLSSESYWESRIDRYLDHNDYSQAWETAKNALRGLRPPGTKAQHDADVIDSFPDENERSHQVSVESFGNLVRRIFEAMADRRLIDPEITDTIRRETETRTRVLRYQGARKDQTLRKPPKPSWQEVERAGSKYALRLVDRDPERQGELMYLPEGIMVYRIAGYFVEKERLKSRDKWLKLCADFNVDPATLEPTPK
jgi:hypothetical protein